MEPLRIYNTRSRRKETFEPLHPGRVGIYVCGPTVYGEPHLGHARPAVTFDVLYRLLTHLGYKVRYVRNVTDVGHLEHDADQGEDKIAKRARLEALEPMEVAQRYTVSFHRAMERLNCLPPSIEPRASGHIIEQIAYIERILKAGYAYVAGGNVYFDIARYQEDFPYGELSGRKLDDLLANTRSLQGQEEKRGPLDFALWKRAEPQHIMRWPSPWGEGFPGWHLECSAMSEKYLGETFDIHGGGLDLMFPHHECELAQSQAALGHPTVRYWVHNNLITIEGQKMGKSLGNFITLADLFSGSGNMGRPFAPMTVRFFVLQAHYRSTLDFSAEALEASGKGWQRLEAAWTALSGLKGGVGAGWGVEELRGRIMEALLDDLNTPIAIAHLFETTKWVALAAQGEATPTSEEIEQLKGLYDTLLGEILGMEASAVETSSSQAALEVAMRYALETRAQAKAAKEYEKADAIRHELEEAGVEIKDTKEGAQWHLR